MTISVGQTILASDIIQLRDRISELESKLNSLQSSSVKKTDIIYYLSPNYNTPTSIYNNKEFETPSNGIVSVKAGSSNSGSLSINNIEVFKFRQSSKYAQPNPHFHVKKGDKILCLGCDIVIFYPYMIQQ